jgi:hypothetical protein
MNLWHRPREIMFCLVYGVVGTLGFAAESITPGDSVVVTKDDVQLGVRDKPMLAVNSGTQIVVTEVRGNWLGGFTYVDGNKRYGWVHQNEVKLVAPVKHHATTSPAKPDNPQDVEVWHKKGVTLHFDETGNIQSLRAEPATLQDQDLKHLAGLSSLLSLDLSNQSVTDAGIKYIGQCRSLEKLYLGGTQVGDAGIEALAPLTELQVLACAKTKVTGAALRHVASLVNLQVLNFDSCEVTDESLANLKPLTQLEVLVLANTKITDTGLQHLRPIAKLRVLNLTDTSIKGEGLENLLGLTELRMLYVRGCPVEPGVTEKLDDRLPGLAIYD